MTGRTIAEFRCPCTEAWAPARTPFWVGLTGHPGFPRFLEGICSRCHDRWVAEISGSVGSYRVYAWSSGIPVSGPDGEVRATWELEELTAERTEELTQITEELTQRTAEPQHRAQEEEGEDSLLRLLHS